MARVKQVKPRVVTSPAVDIPPHVRVPEWGTLKQGDPVTILLPDKKRPPRGIHFKFSYHVTAPDGSEYIDVMQYRVGEVHGLWRSFPLDQVVPKLKK